ncbi:Gfo/Idh/MocA family oxidoreductase [Arthrobacter sp. H5]|uniref:Gfo/Idh/MocA family protein n=1 Tax=Arthrobacter sp. H5 TaxID=1267973 RepID=UPI000481CED4|nr:Gfo/Idh/MocA family oxidoreductase [Arthrobacter sp. H5]
MPAESGVGDAPLRIGIIGAGAMGRKHADIIGRNGLTKLVAVADPATTALAEQYGVPHFKDYRTLLDAGGVDALIIANPNGSHVPTALDCLSAGLPALLEKPIATSYSEAANLVRAVGAGETPILMGHHRRHHPAVKATKDTISRGDLGRLVAISGTWLTKKPDTYFDQTWRTVPGAGVMLINLVHDLDLFRHLCGEIVSVQAKSSNAIRKFAVEDTASVIVEFENGALGSFIISDAVVAPWGWDQVTEDDPAFPFNPSLSCYRIAGTRGALDFPQMAKFHHEGPSNWHHPLSMSFEPKGLGDSYTRQLSHFIDVVRGDAIPEVSVVDGARSLAVIEAAQKAARTGRTVQISEIIGHDAASVS